MKKIALSLAALAALTTASFAASSFDKARAWNELERPENNAAYGRANESYANDSFANGSFANDEAGFAVAPSFDDSIGAETSYDKALNRSMRENPEHY